MSEPNKVIYNGDTLIDLTSDTVTPDKLAAGVTAHDKSGASIVGTAYKNSYYVKGTQTASTNAWTGDLSEVDKLYDGLAIDYWLPFAGTSSAATLNLTLKGGTKTGAIPVYRDGANTFTNNVSSNQIIRLIYHSVTISGTVRTGWRIIRTQDNNDAANRIYNGSDAYQANSAVYRYQLLFQVDENKLTPLNNVNNSQATNKTMLTGVDFLPFGKIFYYNSTTNIAANGNMTSALNNRANFDLRYSLNSGTTLTANRDIYLKCVKQSNGKFRITADPCWTQSLPSTADGYYYLRLGRTYSTSNMYLDEDHPIYYHDGTDLRIYVNPEDAVSFKQLSGKPADNTALSTALSEKADASHVHAYYVKGTQTAVTGTWTGNLPEVNALYEGLAIDYWLPFAGSGNATLNLTLKDGTKTGAVNCYYSGTTRLTTHIGANNIMRLVYQTVTISGTSYTGWWLTKTYDSDVAAYMISNGSSAYQANSVVYRYQLLFQVDENKVTPLNNADNNTNTNKTMLTSVDFMPFGRVFFYNSISTTAKDSFIGATLSNRFNCDVRYTFNCGQTLKMDKDIYLRCLKQSNGKFRISTEPCWTQSLPTSKDGYYYLRLGRAFNSYQMYLDEFNPIYFHDGAGLRTYTDKSDSGLLSIQNNSVFSGEIKYRKIDEQVQINAHRINLVNSLSIGDYIELGTIPVGYRPSSGMYPASVSNTTRQIGTGFNLTSYNVGSRYSNQFVVEIDSDGVIVLYAVGMSVLTSDDINISMMYFTD